MTTSTSCHSIFRRRLTRSDTSLISKLAQLALPDSIYNWAVNFFENCAHCTKFDETISAVAVIHASVIQGSALGPASYILTAADLHPIYDRNRIFIFADDTYLIVAAVNTNTCQEENRREQNIFICLNSHTV